MLMLLMGVLAALIGGSAALSRHDVQERPKGQYEMPQTMLGGGSYSQAVSMEPFSELKYRHIVRQLTTTAAVRRPWSPSSSST